jgi:hypothetical protein
MASAQKTRFTEIVPINTVSFKNLNPGKIITITLRLPYYNNMGLCITSFETKGKKSKFSCSITGTIANHKEYGGYTGTIYIHRDGSLKLEIQT